MSTGDSAVQVAPADQALDVRNFEVRKPVMKRAETIAEHDARLYGTDKVSQHIKKYDTNGVSNSSGRERCIAEALQLTFLFLLLISNLFHCLCRDLLYSKTPKQVFY